MTQCSPQTRMGFADPQALRKTFDLSSKSSSSSKSPLRHLQAGRCDFVWALKTVGKAWKMPHEFHEIHWLIDVPSFSHDSWIEMAIWGI